LQRLGQKEKKMFGTELARFKTGIDLRAYAAVQGAAALVMTNLADKFDLLTLADAAQLLHCSKAHVCKAVAGRIHGCAPIPCVSLGRRRLIRRESLWRWLEANEGVVNGGKLTTLPVRDAGKRG
jgi:hypothetical protein